MRDDSIKNVLVDTTLNIDKNTLLGLNIDVNLLTGNIDILSPSSLVLGSDGKILVKEINVVTQNDSQNQIVVNAYSSDSALKTAIEMDDNYKVLIYDSTKEKYVDTDKYDVEYVQTADYGQFIFTINMNIVVL